MDTKDIAANVRREIRKAIKDGRINLPEGGKVSVRTELASMYSAVSVSVAAPEAWLYRRVDDATYAETGYRHQISPEAKQLGAALRQFFTGIQKPGYNQERDCWSLGTWCNVNINGTVF
ncbi:hypothetical protein [Actinopolymorpha alba]|uniref:hypothetical protein n=1 Tax=Actinopolymorpha alba TaxID=533267 RepID=UPI0003694604|nr:hypothetical protein [Actinopolymorpha alba]